MSERERGPFIGLNFELNLANERTKIGNEQCRVAAMMIQNIKIWFVCQPKDGATREVAN